jgi:hypothetical protein
MNIEIAPKEYRIECSYNEALLYCFQLEIDGKRGWRMPSRDEWYFNGELHGWFVGKSECRLYAPTIIPVRNIINDIEVMDVE